MLKRDGIWSSGGGAGFGNWVLQGVFKARCGFLGFGVAGCGFLGWRAWVLSVGGGVSVGYFSFFKSYFGKRGGGGLKKKRFGIYIYICFGFKVLGFGEGCFWIFIFFTILGERGGGGC